MQIANTHVGKEIWRKNGGSQISVTDGGSTIGQILMEI